MTGRNRRYAPCLASALLTLSACGGRSVVDEYDDDAGVHVDAPAPREGEAEASVPDAAPACTPIAQGPSGCNDIVPLGAPVAVECADGSVPAPSGGKIEDGVYVLESSSFYGGCQATTESDRIVWSICGATWATAQEISMPQATSVLHIDATATVSAASVALALDCAPPNTNGSTFGYDATPKMLTLYVSSYGQGAVRVDHFVRAP